MSEAYSSCPFCGLLCDDLVPGNGGCERAVRLARAPGDGSCLVDGRPVERAEAVRAAAALLRGAGAPLVGGLACDVAGHRAALDLAERIHARVDHMNGRGQFRNWLAFQDGGWMTTTLSEVRNRADLVVLAGTSAAAFPRFFERCLAPSSQFGDLERRVIILGSSIFSLPPQLAGTVLAIPVDKPRLGEFAAALRARLAGRSLQAGAVAGVPEARMDELLEAMSAARYGVLAWNAAELDFPGAELAIQAMSDLVKDLNRKSRWSGLPLGGNDGDVSAAQVCTWRTGYPLRVGFETAGPRYEPLLFDGGRLLEQGETDALVWVSAIDPSRPPPEADCPRIVVGRADLALPSTPDVFIPVGVPGLHHGGFLHRMDGVVALPLHNRVSGRLPSVAQVMTDILEELNRAAA